ncbi:GNAT family N-acetyltransferase [Psychrobacillus sp. OK032]|uniref:GNAT family N-acetyltransferase n=1 Tax=Psychrobacillus sp. OK032 TaxID=1884358 RepID=UPI0008AF9102|nr:GNAT family N-acetyltransferase [Psychrobacillus sp. OK032]SES30366.1 Acetyltransferase (GNAT) family protein [Psychrobacillus sp. OK032]
MEIIEIQQRPEFFKEAVKVFWEHWGSESNYKFYEDCMVHSGKKPDSIPSFYIGIENKKIIGTYALLRNDINSRQDLFPWLACLYVDPDYRGNSIGEQLLEHGLKMTAQLGHEKLYLSSDLEGYYEKYGWTNSTITYGPSGASIKVYEKAVN